MQLALCGPYSSEYMDTTEEGDSKLTVVAGAQAVEEVGFGSWLCHLIAAWPVQVT